MVKKFVYLEVLLILAGIKAALRTGAARYLSFVVIGICAAGIAAHFVVPYFQIYQQPWGGYRTVFDTDMGRYVHPITGLLCFSKYDDAKTRAADGY